MKLHKIYQVEVGILLDKNDIEYDCYSNVWDHKNGYYDENYLFYITEREAKEFIGNYIKKGNVTTYGILSELLVDKQSYEEVKDGMGAGFIDMNYDIRNVIYSAYKNKENHIIENFVDIANYIDNNNIEERE